MNNSIKLPKLSKENKHALNMAELFISNNPGCTLSDIKREINKYKKCLRSRFEGLSYIYSYKNYENIFKHLYDTKLCPVVVVKTAKCKYHYQHGENIPVEILNKEI